MTDLDGAYRNGRWLFSTPLFDVYAGVDLGLEREVHLRVLQPRFTRNAELVNRMFDAAREAASLLHPNLVAVYDIGVLGGRRCVVTEAPAQRFADVAGAAEPERLRELLRDYLAGLAAAHAEGVLHGGIDDSALFVTGDGVGKVADVGMCAAMGTAAAEDDLRDVVATVRKHAPADDPEFEAMLQRALADSDAVPRIPRVPTTQTMPTAAVPAKPQPESQPRPRRRMPSLLRTIVPALLAVALVGVLLGVSWHDTDPPTPGQPTRSHVGSDLPPEIPR